jgi:hypothetical protein
MNETPSHTRRMPRRTVLLVPLALIACTVAGCAGPAVLDVVEVLNYGHCRNLEPGLTRVDYDDLAGIRGGRLVGGDLQTPVLPDDVLLVALSRGAQPTPGYGFGLTGVTRRGAVATIRVNWMTPPADAILAQVITDPCLVVAFPGAGLRRVQAEDQHGAVIGRLELAAPE